MQNGRWCCIRPPRRRWRRRTRLWATAAREEGYTDWGLPFCLADTVHGCIYRSYIDEDEFWGWRMEAGGWKLEEGGMKLKFGDDVIWSADIYSTWIRITIRTLQKHALPVASFYSHLFYMLIVLVSTPKLCLICWSVCLQLPWQWVVGDHVDLD